METLRQYKNALVPPFADPDVSASAISPFENVLARWGIIISPEDRLIYSPESRVIHPTFIRWEWIDVREHP